MTRISGPLKALIDAERPSVGPPADAAAVCWERIVADLERGAQPAFEAPPPPAASHHGMAWLTLMVIGAGVIAAGLYGSNSDRDADVPPPPAVAAFAPVPEASPVPAPAAPAPADPPFAPLAREVPVAPAAVGTVDSRAAARRSQVSPPVLEDTFSAELKLLAEGHAALNRGDTAGALRAVATYQKTYPRGHFKEDREALEVLALCASGKGTALARRFLRTRPRSIHATRVGEACGLSEQSDE